MRKHLVYLCVLVALLATGLFGQTLNGTEWYDVGTGKIVTVDGFGNITDYDNVTVPEVAWGDITEWVTVPAVRSVSQSDPLPPNAKYSPKVVFQRSVEQLTSWADQWNASAVLKYRGHYRDLMRNWRSKRTKFEHRDPDKRWGLNVEWDKLKVEIYQTNDLVVDKEPDPWAIPDPKTPPNNVHFGPAVGPWSPDCYWATHLTTVPKGYIAEYKGRKYILVFFRSIGPPSKMWMPVED
jgi:hypothetical protein